MITRVVFEFAIKTVGGDVAMRIIAAPSVRGVLACHTWRGAVEPTTGMPVEGPPGGRWVQAPLGVARDHGEAPPELLMALAGMLAGAPQPGKPMFMETRVETHHIGDNERGETLTIKLGRITGEPFEAALPGALLGGGRDARALVSLATALGVVQDIKAPGWTDAIHDSCIKAIGDLKQRSLTREECELDHHRKDASRNATIPDEWSMKARQTIIDALPAQALDLERDEATERTRIEAPEMVTVLRGLHLMRRHLDEGGHDWRDGTQMSDVKAACDWLDTTTALLTQQEWLERIRSALGVEHYSLSIKAIAQLGAMRDQAQQRPATRYHIALDGTRGVTIRHHPRSQIWADCCKERRYARNLRVQVYYDCLRFWCRQGKGCKATSAA